MPHEIVEDPGVRIENYRVLRRTDGRLIIVDWNACGIWSKPLAVASPGATVESAVAWIEKRIKETKKNTTPARSNTGRGHTSKEHT